MGIATKKAAEAIRARLIHELSDRLLRGAEHNALRRVALGLLDACCRNPGETIDCPFLQRCDPHPCSSGAWRASRWRT